MIKSLLEYQNVDSSLRDIELALSKSEERKKAKSAKNFLDGANDTLAKLDQRAEELVAKYNGAIKLYSQLSEEAKEYEKEIATYYLSEEQVGKLASFTTQADSIERGKAQESLKQEKYMLILYIPQCIIVYI